MTRFNGSRARSNRPSSIRFLARSSRSSAWSSVIVTADAGRAAAVAGEAASVNEKRRAVSINVLFMESTRLSDNRSGDRAASGGDVFPLPQLVAHDANFEEERRRVDATADGVEIGRADARRTVDDVEQAALELVEH